MGAGELASSLEAAGTGSPDRLESLGTALLSMVGLMSVLLELSLFTSPLNVDEAPRGADQEPTSHDTPVKLLRPKPLRSHLRHGFPDRSSARRPALMAPMLAFGPSLWVLVTMPPPFEGRGVS